MNFFLSNLYNPTRVFYNEVNPGVKIWKLLSFFNIENEKYTNPQFCKGTKASYIIYSILSENNAVLTCSCEVNCQKSEKSK